MPEGSGYLFGDGEYDSRKFLNDVVDKGYMPVIKPRKISAGGFDPESEIGSLIAKYTNTDQFVKDSLVL